MVWNGKWNGTEISVWKMEEAKVEWNGRFQEWNGRQSSTLPAPETNLRHPAPETNALPLDQNRNTHFH